MKARPLKVSGDLGQIVPVPFHFKDDASIEEVVSPSILTQPAQAFLHRKPWILRQPAQAFSTASSGGSGLVENPLPSCSACTTVTRM